MEPEETYIAWQRLGKQVQAATGTQVTLEGLGECCFLFGPCKVVITKSSVENRQSSSGASSWQLVRS
jgi:hypothetical protein